ncbi:MAG: hypothetical protein KDA83_05825 [Planctomycetales bacterium]|nr:hypothetical protein [Planctomycetales bacterium]
MALYRHGDVLIEKVKALPSQHNEEQHLTLAEGEITGHAHRVAEPGVAKIFTGYNADLVRTERYLVVTGAKATVVHEEHGPIELPEGIYRFWQQREYSPQAIRTVLD